jgi:hypothetical protein
MTSSFGLLEQMLLDGILYLSYGIAILSVLKIIVHQLNGFLTESDMGASALEDSTFFGGTHRDESAPQAPSRRVAHLVTGPPKPPLFSPLSSM